MHIPVELYPAAYRSIVNSSRGSGTNVSTTFILVKPDVDALSAAKLLHELLKADYVNNTIIPVRDWDEVDLVKDTLITENVSRLGHALAHTAHREPQTRLWARVRLFGGHSRFFGTKQGSEGRQARVLLRLGTRLAGIHPLVLASDEDRCQ